MATIVLVHGIAQEQSGAATLEKTWIPALADGVAKAGDQVLADRLWRGGRGDIDIRMAYYGTPFIDPGAQGAQGPVNLDSQPLPYPAEELTELLAVAWLEAAAKQAKDPSDQRQAERELAIIRGEVGEAMGPRSVLGRPALNALARLRWFAPFGMAVASRFVWAALTQVTRYLTDDEIRSYAQDQVLQWVGPDTRLVIGHSLGSVVAYEAVHRAHEAGRLPADQTLTLITVGSPLGLQGIVYDRLRPQPPHVPPAADRWENFAAKDDLVAAQLDLTPYFPPASGSVVRPQNHIVDTGSKPHQIEHYLTKPSVGRVVTETLSGK
jgi:fructose-specific component phosphotransferase system IIB-like protein